MFSLANQIPAHLPTSTQAKHKTAGDAVPIVVNCTHCKTRLTLGDDRAGTTLACPRCNTSIPIPETTPPNQAVVPEPQQCQLPPQPTQVKAARVSKRRKNMNRKPVWFYEVKGAGGNEFWLGDLIIACWLYGLVGAFVLWVCWKGIAKPLLSVFFG